MVLCLVKAQGQLLRQTSRYPAVCENRETDLEENFKFSEETKAVSVISVKLQFLILVISSLVS
jgi:hypothetical protein